MKFSWNEFTENDFINYCTRMKNDMISDGDYIGCVRVGDLCFDLVVREYNIGKRMLDYDLYVGGIDDGYSPIESDYPYSFDGGGTFENGIMVNLTYEEFKTIAEYAFEDFITNEGSSHNVSLIEKASETLHVW